MTSQNFSKWRKDMSWGPDTAFSHFFGKTKIWLFSFKSQKILNLYIEIEKFWTFNWSKFFLDYTGVGKLIKFWMKKVKFSDFLKLLKMAEKHVPGPGYDIFSLFWKNKNFDFFHSKVGCFYFFENLKNFHFYIEIWVLISLINHKISIN